MDRIHTAWVPPSGWAPRCPGTASRTWCRLGLHLVTARGSAPFVLDDLLEAIHHAIVSVVANCGVVLELPGRNLVSSQTSRRQREGVRSLTHGSSPRPVGTCRQLGD